MLKVMFHVKAPHNSTPTRSHRSQNTQSAERPPAQSPTLGLCLQISCHSSFLCTQCARCCAQQQLAAWAQLHDMI